MNVQKWIRKSTWMGLGLLAMTKKKVDEMVDQMQRSGTLNEKEGKKLARQLVTEAKKHASRFQSVVEQEVGKVLSGKKKKRKR